MISTPGAAPARKEVQSYHSHKFIIRDAESGTTLREVTLDAANGFEQEFAITTDHTVTELMSLSELRIDNSWIRELESDPLAKAYKPNRAPREVHSKSDSISLTS